MAGFIAKDTCFGFGNTAAPGVIVDRSTDFDNISFPRESEEVETTTFRNAGNRTYLSGYKNASFSGSGNWDPTIDGHIDDIWQNGTVINFEFGPLGSNTGDIRYTGQMVITNYTTDFGVGEKGAFTVDFRIDGTVVRDVYP